jgi:hypothetical protein
VESTAVFSEVLLQGQPVARLRQVPEHLLDGGVDYRRQFRTFPSEQFARSYRYHPRFAYGKPQIVCGGPVALNTFNVGYRRFIRGDCAAVGRGQ